MGNLRITLPSRRITAIGLMLFWTFYFALGSAAEKHGVGIFFTPGLIVYLLGLGLIETLLGLYICNDWERIPELLFGRYTGTKGPGLAFIDPIFHTALGRRNLRDQVSSIDAEAVLTHDNVQVNIEAVVTWRNDKDRIKENVLNVSNPETAILERAEAALTDGIGAHELDQIQHDRRIFAESVRQTLQEKVDRWGLIVSALEIKNCHIMDPKVAEALAEVVVAEKQAGAATERAKAQTAIATENARASQVYKGDPIALELRRLGALETIAFQAGNMVVIPSRVVDAASDAGGALTEIAKGVKALGAAALVSAQQKTSPAS